jgi:hypothetical protein
MKLTTIKLQAVLFISACVLSGCKPASEGKVVIIPNESPRPAELSGFHAAWFRDSLKKVDEGWDLPHSDRSVRLSKFYPNGDIEIIKHAAGQKDIVIKSFDGTSNYLTTSKYPVMPGLMQKIDKEIPGQSATTVVEGERVLGFNGEDWLLEVWNEDARLQIHRWYPGNKGDTSDWVYRVGVLLKSR